MAAATLNKRFSAVLGPMKMEWLNITVTDAETIDTLMQNPEYAIAVVNTDALTTDQACSTSISGKTITLNNADLSDSEVNVFVIGY